MRRSVSSLLATAVLLPLFLSVSATHANDCLECHEADHDQECVHASFECVECHVNIERTPHVQANIEALQGDAICLRCHESALALTESVHDELGCDDCHDPSHNVHWASEDVCADCHRKADRLVGRSVHAGNAKCGDCHEFGHSVTAVDDPESLVAPVQQIRTCGACHGDPPGILDDYLTSAHGKALLVDGFDDAPGCAHCHQGHEAMPVDDEESPVNYTHSPEMCGSCHVSTFHVWREIGAHGKAWAAGNEQAPVCTTCHRSHMFESPRGTLQHLEFVENCGDCHTEYYTTYRVTFHGSASDLKMATAATCADCHEWHRNLPASHPDSSVHPDNLAETCGACHDNPTASFLTFDPHVEFTDRERNPEVFWVWAFMTGLLITVFGFFGIHDLLWLQRALVGMARGEFKPWPSGGPHIRRFSRLNVRMHMVVVTTFLLLAATGLPIKFHAMAWAQPLVNLFGGLEAARVIHRLAAIATFGYALFHVGHIVRRIRQGEKELLGGHHSLVPDKQDLIDIWHNLKFFLYLGPQPEAGKWTYWEKFDYMAVFWGVPIIGLSGLFLWFPNFFAQIFPGWVLNAAHVIHSEEALLATGFIFVFHFFHTDLRPESFPLDPVIFLGSMPLSRFKEERPRDYQYLVDKGELEKHLVDPPTKEESRRARWFGFTALTVGVSLAIAIFWALIAGMGH